jgi:AcrR family transcriptional regulator
MVTRAEQKQRTRGEVLTAARIVIGGKGFAATTARDIADQAGVAVGTVFAHFPTMGVLAETLLDDTVAAALEAGMAQLPDGLIDRLVHVSRSLFDAYDADPELSRQVLAGSLFEAQPDGPSSLRMRSFRTWVAAETTGAVNEGQIPPIDADLAFSGYFALYLGALVAGLRGELDRPAQLELLRTSLVRLFGLSER